MSVTKLPRPRIRIVRGLYTIVVIPTTDPGTQYDLFYWKQAFIWCHYMNQKLNQKKLRSHLTGVTSAHLGKS